MEKPSFCRDETKLEVKAEESQNNQSRESVRGGGASVTSTVILCGEEK